MDGTRDNLNELLSEIAKSGPRAQSPGAYYSQSGDCVFFYNEGVEYRRDRVDQLLTVFRAAADGRIIGLQIKGVSRLPLHDLMEVRVRTGAQPCSETVELLLLTLKRQLAEHELPPSRLTAYFDAMQAANRVGASQVESLPVGS